MFWGWRSPKTQSLELLLRMLSLEFVKQSNNNKEIGANRIEKKA